MNITKGGGSFGESDLGSKLNRIDWNKEKEQLAKFEKSMNPC